ncbi:MAG: SGNH/GDSL hydrolase family protein [Burkholderiales bacterium]|nr:lipase [Burkholderiales bacterium]MDE1926959.1 SGNH/GDSL hydrolase family protein [Burkholderiales bacterium]MDE2157670.1 SGNH/GDSL hydrolase family protein [Burkholderiales bacterium]MDE2503035.1 SGNH/GDSL hydrolase family protein [Burkholderiales bacterium]
MKMNFRSWIVTALGAALLASCGGGDPAVPGSGTPAGAPTTKGNFTRIVSFGDSLSDVGTYAPVTSLTGNGLPPYAGGRFTTNFVTPTGTVVGTVWVENVAATLGLHITPALMGYGPNTIACPSQDNTCTGYGEGGSRVTDPNGIGHSGGALTVPVVTQIANHLARFKSFNSTDLIFIWAGNNDAFAQFAAFGAAAAQIQADAAAGKITADQANTELFQAQTAGEQAMKQAAQDLVNDIQTQILANGGKYVVVITPLELTLTPFTAALLANPATAPAAPVATTFVDTFNLWLRNGLTGLPVELIDANAALQAIAANPAAYGLTNVTTPACDANKINAIFTAAAGGSSLFCNATPGAPYNTLAAGADPSTWLFADSVHPTTGGHKIFSSLITQQLKAFGWI